MAQNATQVPPARSGGAARIFIWLGGIVSFGLLFSVLGLIGYQMVVPPRPHHILLVRDVPLPSGLGPTSPGQTNPLAPGPADMFDSFDFQAIDPQSRLLFIAHTGPGPDVMALAHIKFDPATDGHILVYDLRQNKLIARVPVTQVAGLVVAPDLHKVFAADSQDNRIYSFDETTLKPTYAQLPDNEGPDAMVYDPIDHKVFVSDPGAPADIYKNMNADPNNMNVYVIDAFTGKITGRINFGFLPRLSSESAPTIANNVPKFGYDIGHIKYDDVLHRIYVVTQILPDQNILSGPLPPPGTSEFVTIDPVTYKILNRTVLPATCSTPHGMNLDTQQHVAFIACTDVDPSVPLFQHLLRFNVQTRTAFPDDPRATLLAAAPDMVVIDHPAHLILVGCNGGISVFDESPGNFHKLGDYIVGKGTHSIVVDEQTQYIYLPVPDAGGRPTLHIARYNADGQ